MIAATLYCPTLYCQGYNAQDARAFVDAYWGTSRHPNLAVEVNIRVRANARFCMVYELTIHIRMPVSV